MRHFSRLTTPVSLRRSITGRSSSRNRCWALLLAFGVGYTQPALALPQEPSSANSTQSDRTAGWKRDVDSLLAAIARDHYLFRAKPLPEACEDCAAQIAASVD